MSTNWEEIIGKAAETTNKELSSDIAGLTRLTTQDVGYVAPSKEEKATLAALMKVVHDATKSNENKAKAIAKTRSLLEMAVKVLGRLA